MLYFIHLLRGTKPPPEFLKPNTLVSLQKATQKYTKSKKRLTALEVIYKNEVKLLLEDTAFQTIATTLNDVNIKSVFAVLKKTRAEFLTCKFNVEHLQQELDRKEHTAVARYQKIEEKLRQVTQ